jgi:hypothetical protein
MPLKRQKRATYIPVKASGAVFAKTGKGGKVPSLCRSIAVRLCPELGQERKNQDTTRHAKSVGWDGKFKSKKIQPQLADAGIP